MSARRCPGCGGEFRKGRIVTLVTADGGRGRSKRVCQKCVRRGIVVVAAVVPPVVRATVDPGEAVRSVVRQLKAYAKATQRSPDRELDAEASGRVTGYETAVTLLERIGKDG